MKASIPPLSNSGTCSVSRQSASGSYSVTGGETQRLDGLRHKLAVEAERALNGDLPVAEGGVCEDFRVLGFLEREVGIADALDVIGGKFAVFFAEVLAERLEPLRGVDELYLAAGGARPCDSTAPRCRWRCRCCKKYLAEGLRWLRASHSRLASCVCCSRLD